MKSVTEDGDQIRTRTAGTHPDPDPFQTFNIPGVNQVLFIILSTFPGPTCLTFSSAPREDLWVLSELLCATGASHCCCLRGRSVWVRSGYSRTRCLTRSCRFQKSVHGASHSDKFRTLTWTQTSIHHFWLVRSYRSFQLVGCILETFVWCFHTSCCQKLRHNSHCPLLMTQRCAGEAERDMHRHIFLSLFW